jgi:chemotaxis protein methyltransferase CheR
VTMKISETLLSPLSEFVASNFGLQFPRERWHDLERSACAAARECGCSEGLDGYIRALLSCPPSQEQMEILASHLTIGETYFFREKRGLEILEERIVWDWLRAGAGQRLKIWSAGCATGEEPYSIAIVLSKKMAGFKDRNIQILGTDLNARSLHRASEGTYTEWSFRGTPQWVKRAYFEEVHNSRWAVAPDIKKKVTFAHLNLMDDIYPSSSNGTSDIDVIFCRNVLMYFTAEAIRKVIHRFHCALATDGWLIVSPTETSHELFSEFAAVNFGDATFYRKSSKSLRIAVTWPAVVRDEDKFNIPFSQQATENPEPLAESARDICQKSTNIVSEDTNLSAVSHAQALALYEQGRYEELEPVIVTLLSQNSDDAQTMLLLARTYANQGRLSAALNWCEKAITADKMAARAHYLRATIFQEQGCLSEALLALKQTVYVEPQFVLGHFALGNLALKHGRRKESAKHFENALLLLARYEEDDIVPESEGISVGRLREMIAFPGSLKTQMQ